MVHKGRKHPEEWKKVMSKRNSGKNNSFHGKKHPKETKLIISLKAKARTYLTGIAKLSHENPEIVSGKKNPFYGKKHTKETKLKMSLKRRERFYNLNCSKCNKIMTAKTHNKIYCSDCRKKMDKEYMKKTELKRYNTPKRKLQVKESSQRYMKTQKGRAGIKRKNYVRYAKIKGIKHGFTPKEWSDKKEKAKGKCPRCGEKFTLNARKSHYLTMDHNPPISKVPKYIFDKRVPEGSVYTIDDVQPMCHTCNASMQDNQERRKGGSKT